MSECSPNLASKSPELLHWTDISKKFRICPLYQPKCQFYLTGNSSVYGMPTMRTPEQWDLRDTSSEHGVQSAILCRTRGQTRSAERRPAKPVPDDRPYLVAPWSAFNCWSCPLLCQKNLQLIDPRLEKLLDTCRSSGQSHMGGREIVLTAILLHQRPRLSQRGRIAMDKSTLAPGIHF